MNRLIIIGNGFDLAHGVKSKYEDFLLWYLMYKVEELDENTPAIDRLCSIQVKKEFKYNLLIPRYPDFYEVESYQEFLKAV